MRVPLTLTPSDVTVGSRAQLVYHFEFFEPVPVYSATLDASSPSIILANESGLCTIFSASLNCSGFDGTVIIDFIPWKSGEFVFPQIDFSLQSNANADGANALASNNAGQDANAGAGDATQSTNLYKIDIPAFVVPSVLQSESAMELAPIEEPAVLPGTTYALYGIIIAFVVFLIALCLFFARVNLIRTKGENFFAQMQKSRSYRKLVKKLRKLLRVKTVSDLNAATEMASCFREYLIKQFDYPFETMTTSELLPLMENAFTNYKDEITNLFFALRYCDRIRYDTSDAPNFSADARTLVSSHIQAAALAIEKYQQQTRIDEENAFVQGVKSASATSAKSANAKVASTRAGATTKGGKN